MNNLPFDSPEVKPEPPLPFNQFDLWAARTDKDRTFTEGVTYHAMKLAEEVGEVNGVIAKWAGQGHTLSTQQLIKEMGDVLWHLSRMAKMVGSSLEEVARTNHDKLLARYPEKFEVERSINRAASDT